MWEHMSLLDLSKRAVKVNCSSLWRLYSKELILWEMLRFRVQRTCFGSKAVTGAVTTSSASPFAWAHCSTNAVRAVLLCAGFAVGIAAARVVRPWGSVHLHQNAMWMHPWQQLLQQGRNLNFVLHVCPQFYLCCWFPVAPSGFCCCCSKKLYFSYKKYPSCAHYAYVLFL